MNYTVDRYDNNYENNFDATIADTDIKRNNINSGCIHNNIDNERLNPNL